MINKPAILGGTPEFAEEIPMTRPTLANEKEILEQARAVLASGMLTNHEFVRQFEDKCSQYLGVKHTVAVSSCTIGLMLVMKCLDLSGEVLVPSFTFSATVHAIAWNGLKPVFVDCQPDTFNVSVKDIEQAITTKTAALVGVHIFGNPCPGEGIEMMASEHGIPVIYDAAHGFGARYISGNMVGSGGSAEVFSLSPTKVLVAGEGGLVTTNNDDLATKLRLARNYGNTAGYDSPFSGLNGRMTEFNALIGLTNLERIGECLSARSRLASTYQEALAGIPGLRFQQVLPGARSIYKDLAIYVEPKNFGLSRDELGEFLKLENIYTKKYFYPPTHHLSAYTAHTDRSWSLPVTEDLSSRMLCIPLFSHMSLEHVERIAGCIRSAHRHSPEVHRRFLG
ncbi:MAG: DegT/DnrJ/EryC1/StrS family aminotransferase [Bacillota bacterium]